MKHFFIRRFNHFLLLGGFSLSFLCAGAAHVSTERQNKNLLFEEATGILCTSCPTVQPNIDAIASAYPDANIIAIHGYHFADNTFDLSTEGGDEIVDNFHIVSYPTAMINRVLFSGLNNRFYGVGYWNNFIKREVANEAPVNLWMRSWLDEATGVIRIDIQGYCLEDLTLLDPHLTVVMTQDGILAKQSGQSLPLYTHNHVLRDFITPTWGVPVTNTKAGSYFKMSFEYSLPDKIGVFPVVPEDLKFIAFMTEGDINVMNSTSSFLTYSIPEYDPDDEIPEQPGGEDPEQPGGENPEQPGGENPEQPGGENPEQPGGEDPEQPGGENPEQPGGEDPEQPGGENPEQPGGEDPEEPGEDDVTSAIEYVYNGEKETFTVYDVNGRLIVRNATTVDPYSLNPGLYIVKSQTTTSRLLIPSR